jgi:hypothetical protein
MTLTARAATPALLFTVLWPLALAACGPQPDPSTPQGQCALQAEQDPDVKALGAAYAGSMPAFKDDFARKWEERKKQVTENCLRARGLAPRGGVQKVEPD